MKDIPVLKSKFIMPQLPSAVGAFERLQRLGDEMSGRQLVTVTAPAGYGKTTLMASAMDRNKAKGYRICWFRLDETDRDMAILYRHLVEALFTEEEGAREGPHGHLAACQDIFAQYRYMNALICQELCAQHSLHPEHKTFIVFDDFQQVADKPDVSNAVDNFIDNLPDACTVIVGSRCLTGLVTGKRRLEKNILEITSSDLSFTQEELAGFFKDRYGIIPGKSILQKIMLHTEGWPAGIILACQMISDGKGEADDILDRFDRKELFFQYLLTEILKTADAGLVQFMAKVAILRDFTIAEAVRILEEPDAHILLEQCEQKGFFIQKIPGKVTTFRFHSLFQDILKQHQLRYLSPEDLKKYHLKAAAYYIERRVFDRAIEHFITCGDDYSAVALVAREGGRLAAFGAVDQLRLWYRFLPDELVSGNGYLLFFKSFIHCQRDVHGAMRLLAQALAIFKETGDCAMQINVLVAMAHMHVQTNDVPGMKKINKQMMALSKSAQGTHLENMLDVFDFTVSVWEEKFARGTALYRRVKALPVADEWNWMVLFYAAVMYGLLGDLDRAEDHLREAREIEMVKKADLLMGYINVFHSIILVLKDDQPALSLSTDELMAVGEKYGYNYILGYGKRLKALAAYRRHDLEEALELLDTSTVYFEELNNAAMAASNQLLRCLWLCRRDSTSDLLVTAKKALKSLLARPSGICLQETGLSVFGVIAREAGDYKLADESLGKAIERSSYKGAKQVLSGSCLHLAKLRYDTGDHAGGDQYLRQAFELAESNKYAMFWDMHYPTLVEMALRCIKNSIHTGYALTLITRYYGSEAARFLERAAPSATDDQLTSITDAFLFRFNVREDVQKPKIHVTLLGRFSITVNGVPIPEKEWKTKKIAGILKFLVTHRGRMVSRDQLMDVFWPDADKKSASMSLRAALHELKKVLHKYGLGEEKLSLLHEQKGKLEARAGSITVVDADEFLTLYQQLQILPFGSAGEARKTILERMVSLYTGDYLEEEVYEDWPYAEREHLKSIYLEAVNELAGLYVADGDTRAEKLLLKALAVDPYNEVACHCLLSLYLATKQRDKAVRLYSIFVKRFENDLGIKPDEKLSLVFQKPL